jgi:hypothetical protein
MRELHQLADQRLADRLALFLRSKSISCQVEAEDSSWTVWIHRDEQRADAAALLHEFLADPDSAAVTAAIKQIPSARPAPALTPSKPVDMLNVSGSSGSISYGTDPFRSQPC